MRNSLIGLLLTLTWNAWAEPSNPNTDWFSQAKYGVFIHFLPSGKAGLKQVEQFDVKAVASQLEEMGAGYLVLTLGQNSGYFNAPNAAYEKRTGYAPGERCATRDLPLDLYRALQPKGIRLMLYLPCQTPNQDARAQKAFGLAQGAKDQPIDVTFAQKWSEVIQEWADRYGDKVAGWWFDGGYAHIRFTEAIAAQYAAAVKRGNPKAIVTFNPGVKVTHWTQAEDYTAGELNEPLQVIPAGRWLAGSQWHALTYLGDSWGRRNTRFTDDQWVTWARKVTGQQGVLTLDMGPNYDAAIGPVGQLAEAQVKQVKAIRAALRPGAEVSPPVEPMSVWFVSPAKSFHESCPLGNGRLGAMDFGGVGRERIVLNESSLWSGGPYDGNKYDAYQCLPEVREKLFAGDTSGASRVLGQSFRYADGVRGWGDVNQFGCYQTLGQLIIEFAEISLAGVGMPAPTVAAAGYRRDLNLMQGVAHTQYRWKGVAFTRDLLVSRPDEVIALNLIADQPGALSFTASLRREHDAVTRVDGGAQVLEGQLRFHKPGGGGEGMRYAALLGASAKGGKVSATDQGLVVEGADQVTLIVSAGTNWKDKEFAGLARRRLDAALAKPFDAIRESAVADHRRYMERCQLILPEGPNSKRPTPDRVKAQEESPDPALAALYFQFGRHLVVSGSRPDSPLPTNLQGIWAEEYDTPWRGDFHSNINLQMNYWPVELANLSDCHLPLLRFIQNVVQEGQKTAKAYFNAPGWMANHTQNPWYDTSPSFLPACIGPTCGAWLAQHIWLHYAFTQDKAFLREYYPVLRGASQFMQGVLAENPKTRELVVVPSNSPENSYAYRDKDGKRQTTALCVGATFDQQITRDLLKNTADAARFLGIDEEFAKSLDATRARLAPTRVNADGRIMEWQEDFEETEIHHRHCSHLWGLCPGSEINPSTPELYRGARLSLERRGDASTGWSMAWKANFWARLHDGDRAEKLLAMLIGRGAPNLFCLHAPFQIDGNFGGCAAVPEMLLQSQETLPTGGFVLELLPALPKAWHTGAVRGLRARGGFEVDIAWKEGQLASVTARSLAGSPGRLRHGQVTRDLALKQGETVVWDGRP